MKNTLFLLFLLSWMIAPKARAQQPKESKSLPVKYFGQITLIGNDRRVESLYNLKGSLYITKDSFVVFAETSYLYYPNITPTIEIRVEKVWAIHTKHRCQAIKIGMLGALSGAVNALVCAIKALDATCAASADLVKPLPTSYLQPTN